MAQLKKQLLIVGHVPSPNTQRLRDAALEGASHPDVESVTVLALNPFEAQPEDVMTADGIILGTTENLGYMSGALKDFFDRCYYPCLEQKQGMAYGLYIRAGLDGTGTRRAVETIVTGLRWRAICEPVLCKGEWQESFTDDVRELGMLMAGGLDAGVF